MVGEKSDEECEERRESEGEEREGPVRIEKVVSGLAVEGTWADVLAKGVWDQ